MSDEDWNQRAKSPDTLRLEATVAEMRAALENVTGRLEWALKFTGALTATGYKFDGRKLFVLNYDEANWDNADEWRPVALRHLTQARKALASAPSGMLEATPK